jgi:transglycosylase-like protein with SLT domain
MAIPIGTRLAFGAVIIVGALSVSSVVALAEFRMQERDGVLYLQNVEPSTAASASTSVPTGSPPPATAAELKAVVSEGARSEPAALYRELIRQAADRHAVSRTLVESVMRVESNFQPRAVSPRGASGLMQLMPDTAAQLGVRNVFDVRQNIDGGVRHLRYLIDRFGGDLRLALAAYNAGAEAVVRYGGVPPYAETQVYVARVLGLLRRAALPAAAEAAAAREAAAIRAEAEARAIQRYQTIDGDAVYSNLPVDRLQRTVRALIGGGQ